AFGQPVAMLLQQGGAFFGVEYPAAENHFDESKYLRCGHEFGRLIQKQWLESEWVVSALTPDEYVKLWFSSYLDDIRVAPLKPYTLYNSWYDLRSPEYPRVPPENVMSEETSRKMIDLLRTNMVEKHGIHLDAFVLDDGWDVYKSDWALRPEQFPNGLAPLTAALQKMGTHLGIWIGPTGGYSLRKWRIDWMRENGYELVGNQLCVAGVKYKALLQKRVADFARKDGVNYFKWDGIQFSCSEPDHGHPIDIYSRRAVLQSMIDLCHTAREHNPEMFLNITSGTWLSPWWVQYANTIWMDGQDYGYADVPSISQRDGAITYRDFVLYEDFHIKDLWFPIANLMTHGIIKGKLQLLGSAEEPLDKFTDDVLLYFARGVAMYELYISPDILTEGEWDAISGCIAWARDRFPVLMQTEMIGGNPMQRRTYGYVHFKDDRGIIAARNPFIESAELTVPLSPAYGLNPTAKDLVLERIYPTRWISPRVYRTCDDIILPLEGYETAVYELYPLQSAAMPLLAGAHFEIVSEKGLEQRVLYYGGGEVTLLNPASVRSLQAEGAGMPLKDFRLALDTAPPMVTDAMLMKLDEGDSVRLVIPFTLAESCHEGMLAVLVSPEDKIEKGQIKLNGKLDGQDAAVKTEYQEGRSQWYTMQVPAGPHQAQVLIERTVKIKGHIQVWMVAQQEHPGKQITLTAKSKIANRLLPPQPWPKGFIRRNVKLGEAAME
ncbi:alpha-galactosidase, partial [candidate division KSB1 bacterium]|nr:alpha-galactosidase [candidate division KSB1 bacterium]